MLTELLELLAQKDGKEQLIGLVESLKECFEDEGQTDFDLRWCVTAYLNPVADWLKQLNEIPASLVHELKAIKISK